MAPCFNEFFPLVRYYQKNSAFIPVVYFDHAVSHAKHQASQCRDSNIIALDEFGNIFNTKNEATNKMASERAPKSKRLFLKKIYRRCLSPLYNPFVEIKYLLRRYLVFSKIIKNYKPSAIILGMDMAHLDSSLIVKTAKKNGIPCIALTWVFASGDDPANVYINKNIFSEYQGSILINKLLLKFFPKYQYTYKNVVLSRLPAMQALVREVFSLGVPRPWVMNSGYCDSIIIESAAMFAFYLKAGLPIQQLKNLGAPMQDVLSYQLQNKDQLKEKLYRDYCFDCKKPLLLTAIVPCCFEMLKGQTDTLEFSSYEEALTFWINKIKKMAEKYNILYTIHPGESQATREELENRYKIKILKITEVTTEVLPLADLYITAGSSTVRWAIACRIPVLDYDFYNLGNHLGDVARVVKANSKRDFENKLDLIFKGALFYKDLEECSDDARFFGLLDGYACDRISLHINELIYEKN